MTKQALKRTVGFCAAAWQASTSRWVDGALRYVTATPGLAFRDFSFQQDQTSLNDLDKDEELSKLSSPEMAVSRRFSICDPGLRTEKHCMPGWQCDQRWL